MGEQSIQKITVNGIELAYLEYGSGPLLICLHGFPDTAYTYAEMAPQLAEQGYRVVVPFLRGYFPSAIAADGDYTLPTLARDVLALIDALYEGEGEPSATLIGHDWGGLTAYNAANLAPEKINQLVCMAMPHMGNAKMSWQQFKNMWYILLFQLPALPELIVRRNNFSFIDTLYRRWSPSWQDASANVNAFKTVVRQPNYLAATLAYYRCITRRVTDESKALSTQNTAVPSLWFMGREDKSVDIGQVDNLAASFPKGVELVVFDDAGHFPHCEKPAEVTARIIEFLSKPAAQSE